MSPRARLLQLGCRLAKMSSRLQSSVLGGRGGDGEDHPITDFGESLDLEKPGARATEQPQTQTGEVQLERRVSKRRPSGHIYRHDDVAIRTIAEISDKRVVANTQK
ncbi:uncharacterized protein LOC142559521 [Dermacentor variabilis]|uniref:uncharacterized protein LOC142559521 n=1 Tax=Dermacentor variabilis TaxID=34621 RepID=UPI003F5BAF48